eukprot:s489_g10.t1
MEAKSCAGEEMTVVYFGLILSRVLEVQFGASLGKMLGAIDWTHGRAARMTPDEIGPWLQEAVRGELDEGKFRIHVSEMLAFIAFAATCGASWKGKVVINAGDSTVVKFWIAKRQSASRAGRLLIRVLAMCDLRYGFIVVAGWRQTFHNVDSGPAAPRMRSKLF